MIDINIQYLPSRIICISKIQVLLLKARKLVIRDPSFKDGHNSTPVYPTPRPYMEDAVVFYLGKNNKFLDRKWKWKNRRHFWKIMEIAKSVDIIKDRPTENDLLRVYLFLRILSIFNTYMCISINTFTFVKWSNDVAMRRNHIFTIEDSHLFHNYFLLLISYIYI